MAEMTIKLTVGGYWREPNVGGVPAQSGIYCVYTCTHNPDDTVALKKLVYIGEAANVQDRIQYHEKWEDWRRHLRAGEQLCFTFAPITNSRERGEAAMIHHHKPAENVEYRHSFPFDTTTMSLSGQTALLDTFFTVYKTTASAAYRW